MLGNLLYGTFVTLKKKDLLHYACMNADRTLTAPFIKQSLNAFVICVVREGNTSESCLPYDVLDHLGNHAMKILQTEDSAEE